MSDIRRFALRAVVSGHSPITDGRYIAEAIELMRKLPTQEPFVLPGQEVLEAIQSGAMG